MHTIFIYEHSSGRLTLSFVKSDYVRDSVWACFVCLVAHLLLPTPKHEKRAILGMFFVFGTYSIPPPTFKHRKHACLGTFSVFDHLQPPLLVFHFPPFPPHSFLTLPRPSLSIFSLLGTFYLFR